MLSKKTITAMVFVLIAATYRIASSEPTPKINYLMNEPASLFDLGMYRLGEGLSNAVILKENRISAAPFYDWDKNRIKIKGFSSINKSLDMKEAKLLCSDVIRRIKSYLMVDSETGKSFLGTHSIFESFFSHDGYKNKSEPSDLYSDIDNITEIEAYVGEEGKEFKINCKSPLMSKEIMFSSE